MSQDNSIIKHAYLIEAHNNFEQLEKLLKELDYEYNDIYIHVDKKSKIPEYIQKMKLEKSKLKFIEPREFVQWGGYNQIKVEIKLIEEALNNKEQKYGRLHLISGVDIPLKTQKDIHDFFDANKELEFIHFDYDNNRKNFESRMSQYHILINKFGRKSNIALVLDSILVFIQKIVCVNRIRNERVNFYKGANWFSITGKCAQYIIEKKSWIEKTFKYTKCCDEVFLQTIVKNSKFKENLYYDEIEKRNGNLRLIDWKRGNPYIFKTEDFNFLIESHYMFARKFDTKIDSEIINKIYNYLNNEKKEREEI